MTNFPLRPGLPGRSPRSDIKARLIVYAFAGGVVVTFLAIVHLGNIWRVYYFPHAIATVRRLELEVSHDRRGHQYRSTVGELTFVRQHHGQSYNCDERMNLGGYPSSYTVGQQLDVVPRTGTCWHPLIVYMVRHWKR